MSHPAEHDLDNALVKVKDSLISNIDTGDYERLQHILSTLVIMQPLINTCCYHYKMAELCERAIDILQQKRSKLPIQARRRFKEHTSLMEEFDRLRNDYRNSELAWKTQQRVI